MKTPFFSLSAFCFGLAATLAAAPVHAGSLTPPIVAKVIADVTVPVGSAPTVVNLKKVFAAPGESGQMVRFSTTVGNVDVELLDGPAPATVAAFLSYANNTGDNGATNYSYTDTLIQRSIPGFIVQGGGYYVDSSKSVDQIEGRPAIKGEAGVKNTRGTLAMALSTGPDSATGDYFFNVADNAQLDDTSDGGPFTVFGRVPGDLSTLDAITALTTLDFSSSLGDAFQNVPLVNYDASAGASVSNLVYLNTITPLPALPLTPKNTGDPAILTLKVKNTNPDLVTATLSGHKLTLACTAGKTGTASITVKAVDFTGQKAKATFTVTVQ